jgi:replicative DNA helicase
MTEAAEEKGFDFEEGFQRKIVALTLRDSAFAARTIGLLEPGFFEREIDGALTKVALDYYDRYKKAPSLSVIVPLIKDAVADKRIRKDMIPDIKERLRDLHAVDLSDRDYVTDKVSEFAKNKAIERAILASVEDHAKGDYEKIRKRMEQAMLVGAADDGNEYDYFEELENRTDKRKLIAAGVLKREGISTGYDELDKCLYHGGWGRKELSCIMGAAKAGKSMSLGEFGKNAAMMGYNVDYLTCEVSSEIIADRTDANLSGFMMKELDKNPIAVRDAIDKLSRKGNFKFHEYASGTLKPSQIRRLLERKRSKGYITDLLIVDYADIMAAEFRSDDRIETLRSIYVDLRAIAFDYNVALLTATQTNREGAKKMTASATDVSADWNKAMTVDALLSINASEAEKAAGEARLFFALSRNSESEFSLRIKQDRSRMRFIEKIIGRE